MKGLELSRRYYEECGRPMLERDFPSLGSLVAVGLTGSGSECYGYDDEISRDHDFEPGFCIFIPGEDVVDERTAFLLERAYSKLPKTFMGFERKNMAPVGGARHGVFRASEYFLEKAGTPDGLLSVSEWLTIPESALAEATNGEIFRDDSDLVTLIRGRLLDMPLDILKKKLAGCLVTMSQAGAYNYPRCIERKDAGAARLAVREFVNAAMRAVFLLNRRYMPYYKWSFRAMRDLEILPECRRLLEQLLYTGPDEVRKAEEIIRTVSLAVGAVTVSQKLASRHSEDLEKLAYDVNDTIEDVGIRALSIFAGA